MSIILFRPMGPRELELIRASAFTAFPPRLPEQPIFYPVLNQTYAEQIARDWNARNPSTGFRGYVTRFEVEAAFLADYEVRTVGSSIHQEYWIPAAELDQFNAHIVGRIEVVKAYTGSAQGDVHEAAIDDDR